MEEKSVKDIVEALNYELFEKNEEELGFAYITSGMWEAVMFDEHTLWCDQNDEREYFDGNNREPLETFIKREFNKYADRLSKLKFKRVPKPPTVEE